MTQYTNYQDILFKNNWTGKGSSNTVQILHNGLNADSNGFYNFNYIFAQNSTDISSAGYYNTPTNNIDGTGDTLIYDEIKATLTEQEDSFKTVTGQSGFHSDYDSYYADVAKINFNSGSLSKLRNYHREC